MSTGIECCPDFCLCELCVYDRIKKVSHGNLVKKSDYPIEYIHTNIAGPLPVAS